MKVVLDACAVIALFKGEEGAKVVESYLSGIQYDCMIHNLNLCEVYYEFLRVSGKSLVDSIVNDLRAADVTFRADLTETFWKEVGGYKASIKRISLADCCALTLASQESGILVTSDRHEFEPIATLDICQIVFIR